jgi:UDP-N-acetylmuramoyl-L-alanyl-D-glutamate--2,6-diaminopimelate ligase
MTLRDLLPETQLTGNQARMVINQLTLDSRTVTPGDAFVAVPGESVDGRRFMDQALTRGASCILAEAADLDAIADERVVPIGRLREQLGVLAARFYGTRQAETLLLGVTGTNGKTSVTWFLRDALSALGNPCALIGTLGTRFAGASFAGARTTPDVLSLHRVLADFRQRGAKACAMEVSSHALVQGRVDGIPIRVAIFTNLSRDHLDYHGDMESYFAAKARLFARAEVTLAVINRDDEHGRKLLDRLSPAVRAVTFGRHKKVDARVIDCQPDRQGMTVRVAVADEVLACRLPLYGEFNLSNVLAVVASLYGLGYGVDAIGEALAALTPVPGRMEPVTSATGPTVLVDYAHTPDGLEKALEAARTHFDGDLWCVVGCGGNRDTGKRPQMAAIAERLADHVMLTSDNPRDEEPQSIINQMVAGLTVPEKATQEIDRARAIAEVIHRAGNEDLVLICGKGHEDYQEIRGQRLPLDDRLLAKAALEQRLAVAGGDRCV